MTLLAPTGVMPFTAASLSSTVGAPHVAQPLLALPVSFSCLSQNKQDMVTRRSAMVTRPSVRSCHSRSPSLLRTARPISPSGLNPTNPLLFVILHTGTGRACNFLASLIPDVVIPDIHLLFPFLILSLILTCKKTKSLCDGSVNSVGDEYEIRAAVAAAAENVFQRLKGQGGKLLLCT